MPDDERPGRDDLWSRGGAWVLAQFPLTALTLYAARVGPTLPHALLVPARWLGAGLLVSGVTLFLAGLLRLGPGLTPFPKPLPDARLIQTGVYGVARHPIYGGGTIATFGWALLNGGWLGLLASFGLAVFFNAKANVEEAWLDERFPEYRWYRRRVAKLIPFVF
ncbi:MAG: isoprenylcysteine carboxylmethyltransferase family protein [Chloroflexota bacterium]